MQALCGIYEIYQPEQTVRRAAKQSYNHTNDHDMNMIILEF